MRLIMVLEIITKPFKNLTPKLSDFRSRLISSECAQIAISEIEVKIRFRFNFQKNKLEAINSLSGSYSCNCNSSRNMRQVKERLIILRNSHWPKKKK